MKIITKPAILFIAMLLGVFFVFFTPSNANAQEIPPHIVMSGSCGGGGNSQFLISNMGGAMTVSYTWELYQNTIFITSGPFTLSAEGNLGSSFELTINGLYGDVMVIIRDNLGQQIASATAFCPTPTPTVTRTPTPTPIPPHIVMSGSCGGGGNSQFLISNTGGAMTVSYTWELYQNTIFITSGPFTLSAEGNLGSSIQLTINGLYGDVMVIIHDNLGQQIASATAFCPTPTPTFTATSTFTPTNSTTTPTITTTNSLTPSLTLTNTITPSPTFTSTFTASPTQTSTPTFTITPTHTMTASPTMTHTLPPPPLVIDSEPKDGAVLSNSPMQLAISFSKDVVHDGSINAADNTGNYLLIGPGPNRTFDTLTCLGGRQGDDLMFNIDSAVYSNNNGVGPFEVLLNLPQPLLAGKYRLFVCGTTSIQDFFGNKLNDGRDMVVDFRVEAIKAIPKGLPETGFVPGKVLELQSQPLEKGYSAIELSLRIPKLGASMPILGVPIVDKTWDVSWLGNNVGWLENSSFPTLPGNTVLTGHVWNADNTPGIFVRLSNLRYGDKIEVRFDNQVYTYEVTENQRIKPDQIDLVFQSKSSSWLTLVTCEGFDEKTSTYNARRFVRAVLVKIKVD